MCSECGRLLDDVLRSVVGRGSQALIRSREGKFRLREQVLIDSSIAELRSPEETFRIGVIEEIINREPPATKRPRVSRRNPMNIIKCQRRETVRLVNR